MWVIQKLEAYHSKKSVTSLPTVYIASIFYTMRFLFTTRRARNFWFLMQMTPSYKGTVCSGALWSHNFYFNSGPSMLTQLHAFITSQVGIKAALNSVSEASTWQQACAWSSYSLHSSSLLIISWSNAFGLADKTLNRMLVFHIAVLVFYPHLHLLLPAFYEWASWATAGNGSGTGVCSPHGLSPRPPLVWAYGEWSSGFKLLLSSFFLFALLFINTFLNQWISE